MFFSLETSVPSLLPSEPADEYTLPWFETYCPPRLEGMGVVAVFPGGGYHRHASHEGHDVALWLNSLGLNAVVVHYSVIGGRLDSAESDLATVGLHPAPLSDAQKVIAFLRSDQTFLKVNENRVGAIGFSAGGHLAATLSTNAEQQTGEVNLRPDLTILGYPVISMVDEFHQGSADALTGFGSSTQTRASLSADQRVNSLTPPTFIWHTADDASVLVSNSLKYADALAANNIPYELHVFPEGVHGLGLAQEQPGAAEWPRLARLWLDRHGWLE